MHPVNRFDPGQHVIICQEDPESGETIGYYGTVIQVLAESKIRLPESPHLWQYRVSVPYMQRAITVPARMLVATGMRDGRAHAQPDWKICFDRIPENDNETISGSYRLPNTGTTYFLFQKSDSDVLLYKLSMQIGETRPEWKLIYEVPRPAKLDSVYVRDSIRKLIGIGNALAGNNVTAD